MEASRRLNTMIAAGTQNIMMWKEVMKPAFDHFVKVVVEGSFF